MAEPSKKKNYREKMINMIRAAGQEIAERAEDIAPREDDLTTDFSISITFPELYEPQIPEITVNQSMFSKKIMELYQKGEI